MPDLEIPWQFRLTEHDEMYLMAVREYLRDLTRRLDKLPEGEQTPLAVVRMLRADIEASGLGAEEREARERYERGQDAGSGAGRPQEPA
jgi:hypothetical protein